MKYENKIRWAFVAAITVSVCWIVGDIFIVGYKPDPEDYKLFSVEYADKVDVDIAIHMLSGSTERLMLGALIAALSAPLLLPAMWLVYQSFSDKKQWHAKLVYYLLLAGAVLSPFAHAAFFYVGEIYKAILHTDKAAHEYLLKTANSFVKILFIGWWSAIGVLALGWLAFTISVFMGKTVLPRWAGLFTPFLVTIYQHPIVEMLPEPARAALSGAGFNIAYFVFFVFLFVAGRIYICSLVTETNKV
ncbi:MAG: hypothetical protein KF862_14930 [Chitinophagaceae bacterium]|nr:hypothetical protein [Chitinophagaceae bacterium]